MEIGFWEQRWQENQIGFHLDQVNPWLVKFWGELKLAQGNHVFVPMCGKSLDLLWLEKMGHCVTGVECSQLAVANFFAENNIAFNHIAGADLNTYKAGNIQLLQGDFFAVNASLLTAVTAVYDRAALIALPAEMRKRYVAKLFDVLPTQTAILLITLEYNQAVMTGPPFSVSEMEVQALYGKKYGIRKLQQKDVLPEYPRFAQQGLANLLESVYLLQPVSSTRA